MSNPTTPFSWQMPTATDLVTDLPADFEVFGQAVATSMQDLLGGTTGQVLSKASNADMDFTFVTPTDQTPLTTKGDLFTFTTTDARLAVGANFAFLQADSTAATGLLWDNAAWTSYTPTITAGSGTFTTVSGSGRYKRIGKLCTVQITVTITTNGTAATNVQATLPFSGTGDTQGVFREGFATGNCGIITQGGSVATFRTFTNGYPGGTGYILAGSLTYEVA